MESEDLIEAVQGWSPQQRADRLRDLVTERRRLDAEIARLVNAVDRTGAYRADGHRSVNAWCRASVRWSDAEAARARRIGHLLADQPVVAEPATQGRLGETQLDRLARAYANPRCGDRLPEFLAILVRHAQHLPCRDFELVIDRWISLADADGTHQRHQAAHHQRSASLHRVGAEYLLHATFGITQGAQLEAILARYLDHEWHHDRLTTTDAATEPPRTARQRAADALVRIFLDAAASGHGPDATEFCVNVVIAHDVLDTVEARAHGDTTTLPDTDPRHWWCHTTDGVPLDPHDAIAMAVIGHVRRVVIDARSVVTDVGRRRRTFTGPARDAVLAVAGHCDWNGCNTPASRCQADHELPWARDGNTTTRNARGRCGPHNRLRTHGYQLRLDRHGYWHTHRPDGTEI